MPKSSTKSPRHRGIRRHGCGAIRGREALGLRNGTDGLWQNLVVYYWQAYDKALRAAGGRSKRTVYDSGAHTEQVNFVKQQLVSSRPTWTRLIVEVSLPERLRPLEILSKNLWWSWASGARGDVRIYRRAAMGEV